MPNRIVQRKQKPSAPMLLVPVPITPTVDPNAVSLNPKRKMTLVLADVAVLAAKLTPTQIAYLAEKQLIQLAIQSQTSSVVDTWAVTFNNLQINKIEVWGIPNNTGSPFSANISQARFPSAPVLSDLAAGTNSRPRVGYRCPQNFVFTKGGAGSLDNILTTVSSQVIHLHLTMW